MLNPLLKLDSHPLSNNSKVTWDWHIWEGLPYLTCSLLNYWSHGFFTRQFSPREPAVLVQVLNREAQVYRVKQVHGAAVLSPSEVNIKAQEQGDYPFGDGLITEVPLQSIWVCSADCTPALIGDVKTGRVGAVHAGWRGTGKKILPEAIARLVQAGSHIPDLRVALGPAIAGDVYQVTTEVAAQVVSSLMSNDLTQLPLKIIEYAEKLPDSPILPDDEPGKVRLDVRKVNSIQLQQLGLNPEQIAIAPQCTYQDPENFFSYRREALKKVQWSGIVSN
ncbi:peptidoglycan editing factor PgeF [Merismopedia glauca]|uniref:Purine nucleoside phosphorylase n=1 Tax=Merismopedia glauca CCAP 1448/3 TaxID=1296344 RepID=A0A2T1CAJ2_9CYAN|nr:peptidoglycan editing factor PgeF [Merismopedia glauca]PSB05163.1 peptidoglycan editing factor PgeF [Merismopedia glauca CCAP 1448/3]